MENLTEQKPLTKQISAAINAIQKEIERKNNKANKLFEKAVYAQNEGNAILEEITGLQDTISKLKGE